LLIRLDKILIIFFFSLIYGQQPLLTGDEVKGLFKVVREFEIKDSLNNEIIKELELSVKEYEYLVELKDSILFEQDSLLVLVNKKYDLCAERLEEVEPGLFDNKYLWFIYGFLTKSTITGELK